MKKTAKKRNVKSIIFVTVIFIVCFAFGFFIAGYMDTAFGDNDYPGKILLNCAALYVCTLVSLYLQVIIHEGGHLLFGLMSGYKFSSFRIGSLMLAKIDGKIRFRRFELSGTGGQCLMDPPEMTESEIPYKLYNLGGSLANLITAAVFFALWIIFAEVIFLNLLLLLLAIVGLAYALLNGIPMHTGGIDNDGMNVLSLGKDIEAQRALWIQMKVANEQLNGKSLREMPSEWFTLPSSEDMKNPMKAAIGVMACNRLIDEHRCTEAAELIKRLLDLESGMVGIHRSQLKFDLLYCLLTDTEKSSEERRTDAEALLDAEMTKSLKTLGKLPGTLRTAYTKALLYDDNKSEADRIMKQFESIAKNYPYKADIRSERELVERTDKIYAFEKSE